MYWLQGSHYLLWPLSLVFFLCYCSLFFFLILLVLCGLPFARSFPPCVNGNYLFLLMSSPDCPWDVMACRWLSAKLSAVFGHGCVCPSQGRCRIWVLKAWVQRSHSALTGQCPPWEPSHAGLGLCLKTTKLKSPKLGFSLVPSHCVVIGRAADDVCIWVVKIFQG